MKILVTGTAGFIGFHLVKVLLERGDEVIGIDNINNYYDVRLKYGRLEETGIAKEDIDYNVPVQSTKYDNYTFIKLDLSDRTNIEHLFAEEKFDCVCNLAAQAGVRYSIINPHAYIDSNVIGFMNILEGCRHNEIGHLVYASSSSVYGLNEGVPFSTEDHTNHPVSLYAATKKSNELMAHTYSHLYNVPTTGLRFFTVYGPWGRPDMAYFLFADAITKDKPIKVFNNGAMSRDFTYVDDIVEGIVRVIDNPAKGSDNWNPKTPMPNISKAPYKVYNIGNNQPVKLMDFIECIEEAMGVKAKKKFLPLQAGDVVTTWADTEDLIKDVNYQPATSVKTGINTFVKWYKSFYQNMIQTTTKNAQEV